MARLHLFEIEDQAWCPPLIREATTDFLVGLYNLFDLYEPAFEKINWLLDKTQTKSIIDCCSGSGGPLEKLREYLDQHQKKDVIIYLTDKYPNLQIFANLQNKYPQQIIGVPNSVSAEQIPSELKGMRTFFSSFHHFKPEFAKKILQDAVNNNAPIAIFECTQRHVFDITRSIVSPLMMPFIIPFSKRLTWQKFCLTYLIPITPFTHMWDYFVSNLRTYSASELNQLIAEIDAPHYKWEIGKLWSKKGMTQLPYLLGYSA